MTGSQPSLIDTWFPARMTAVSFASGSPSTGAADSKRPPGQIGARRRLALAGITSAIAPKTAIDERRTTRSQRGIIESSSRRCGGSSLSRGDERLAPMNGVGTRRGERRGAIGRVPPAPEPRLSLLEARQRLPHPPPALARSVRALDQPIGAVERVRDGCGQALPL